MPHIRKMELPLKKHFVVRQTLSSQTTKEQGTILRSHLYIGRLRIFRKPQKTTLFHPHVRKTSILSIRTQAKTMSQEETVFLKLSAAVSGVTVLMYIPVLFSNPAQTASLG